MRFVDNLFGEVVTECGSFFFLGFAADFALVYFHSGFCT